MMMIFKKSGTRNPMSMRVLMISPDLPDLPDQKMRGSD